MIFAEQFLQISTKLASSYIYGFGEHMHETFLHDMNWKSHGMFSRDQGVGVGKILWFHIFEVIAAWPKRIMEVWKFFFASILIEIEAKSCLKLQKNTNFFICFQNFF